MYISLLLRSEGVIDGDEVVPVDSLQSWISTGQNSNRLSAKQTQKKSAFEVW